MNLVANHLIKGLILDMDGVLWRDDQPIGDLPAIFSEISRRNLKVILATNNATLSVEQYQKKLNHFGVSIEASQIVNSALAAAHYLAERFPQKGNVFIIGEQGLIQTLSEHGFHHSLENVIAVVVALDRNLTFEKLRRATQLIRAGIPFIGTNPDRTFPTPEGLIPGAGSILAALEASTEVKPVIVGKPSPEMYKLAIARLHTSPEETLVVGDRLETDIVGAQSLGCRSALVLSGVTHLAKAVLWDPAPDFIEPDLASLLERL
jgi:4-nitrophenyl phosphatase